MPKILVVYYSFEGNTHFLAENIAHAVNGDLLRLVPEKDLQSKGFSKYFWGGQQVVMRSRPALKPFDKNPLEYDVLFIGTPVWAYTFSPALRSFFTEAKLQGKKVALFCCHGGGMRKTQEHMTKALIGNEIVGAIDFMEPLLHNPDACAKQVAEWARGIISKL